MSILLLLMRVHYMQQCLLQVVWLFSYRIGHVNVIDLYLSSIIFLSSYIHQSILSSSRSKSFCILLYIFAVHFPEFSLACNNSPFWFFFPHIHPPLFSRVLAWLFWLLKACTFVTNHLFVTNIKIIPVAARFVFLHCCIFVVLCPFYYLTKHHRCGWFCPR